MRSAALAINVSNSRADRHGSVRTNKYPRGRPSKPAFSGRHDRRHSNWIGPWIVRERAIRFANAKRRGLRAANDRKGCLCLERQ
jgi:hypothetical protein